MKQAPSVIRNNVIILIMGQLITTLDLILLMIIYREDRE